VTGDWENLLVTDHLLPVTDFPMERRKKIDESLKERHGIVRLLERLKSDNITFDEIEEIGVKLKKAGKRALSPLVRRLWRERSGDLISKYTYLLDFFDDDVWLDQLIQITLRRRDLEEDGKAAFLAALEGYGVDVTSPPFAALLAEVGGPLQLTLPRLLEKGEEGQICFMDDFLFASMELRRAIIRELPYVADPRVLSLLEILLRIDDPEIAAEAVTALGKIRSPDALTLLQEVRDNGENPLRELACKSLRRLSFLGMETVAQLPSQQPPQPFYATCASPFDGAGFRTLWLCRWGTEGRLASLFVQIHETRGMTAAWGNSRQELFDCAKQWEEIRLEEGVLAIAPDYTLQLLNDAIYRSGSQGALLPSEFYVLAGMFQKGEIAPVPYEPDFTAYDPPGAAVLSRQIARSAALFDDDYFAAWFLASPRVYDYAEEWIELEKNSGERVPVKAMESLVERFCSELLAPEMETIRGRLKLTADLMRHTGREKELVGQALAVAMNLMNSVLPLHRHPFLKRFALESMDMARESLAEGYDLREHQCDEDDWE
jgi:hypothetical protein